MPAFFIRIGTTNIRDKEQELWVIQIGVRPGSEYILLSRAPEEGLIDTFKVLQSKCPKASMRDGGTLDILATRYCSINGRAELQRLAREMEKLPPMGTLSLIPDENSE